MFRKEIKQIQFQNLNFVNTQKQSIFNNLNADISMGGFIWLRGASGSGKSLLLKMIMGTLSPESGCVKINDKSLAEFSFEEFLPYRINMGLSFDFGGLINNRDLFGNLALPLEYHKFGQSKDIEAQVNKYLEIFNLSGVASQRPSSVMGGMRKATCVARAFVHEPQLLLLDDPTTGLNIEVKHKLLKHLQQIKQTNRTVIIASEDTDFVTQLEPLQMQIVGGQLKVLNNKMRVA